jgi:hypothetical protein
MKNRFEHNSDGTTTIYCNRYGEEFPVLIDTPDFPKVSMFPNSWCVQWNKNTHYAYGNMTVNRKREKIYMHRWITEAKEGMVVDHFATHNGTDNRHSNNLRETTYSENNKNKRDKSIPLGNPDGLNKFLLRPRKAGNHIFWAASYVKGVYMGRYKDYADAMFVQFVGNAVLENATDKQLLDRIVPLGHKEEAVQSVIDNVRKMLNKPNPTKSSKVN